MGLTNKKMIGVRDPLGIRPLVLGELDGSYILASETCALDIIGANFIREIENGELVVITKRGLKVIIRFRKRKFGTVFSNTSTSLDPTVSLGGHSVMNAEKALTGTRRVMLRLI